jgi:hypothetical protein
MECKLYPGQKVICVDVKPRISPGTIRRGMVGDGRPLPIKEGEVYTINNVFFCEWHQSICVYLNEVTRDIFEPAGYELGFYYGRFVPLKKHPLEILYKIAANPDDFPHLKDKDESNTEDQRVSDQTK